MRILGITHILEYADANYNNKLVSEVPLDGIDNRVVSYIKHAAGVLRAPTNFVFGEVITVFGGMLGKKVTVADGDYRNRCNLFSAIVGVASGAKSPTINKVMKPINLMETKRYEDFMREFHAAKSKEDDLPIYDKQVVASNETIENLYRVLYNVKSNDGGLLMHQDELLNFFGSNTKKYSDGNIVSDFLTLFDAFSPLRVGRVRLETPLYVPEPFLAILGGIQKKRIDELFAGQEHNGFFSRWQFWLPNEDSELLENPDKSTEQIWTDLLDRVTSTEWGKIELKFENRRQLLSYDDEYRTMRDKLENDNEDELSETIMKEGYIIRRLAAIFHCINALAAGYVPSDTIRTETVEYAAKVVEWLYQNSAIAQRVIVSKRKSRISGKDAIIALDAAFGIKNQVKFSESLGGHPNQKYISRILGEAKK